MAKYRIRKGATLPHNGELLREGAEVELSDTVAQDIAVRWLLEPVDDAGKTALSMPYWSGTTTTDIKGAPHERIPVLTREIQATERRLDELKRQLEQAKAEEQDAIRNVVEGRTVQSIGGVPITLLAEGQGGTTAHVAHGEPSTAPAAPTSSNVPQPAAVQSGAPAQPVQPEGLDPRQA